MEERLSWLSSQFEGGLEQKLFVTLTDAVGMIRIST